MKKSSEISNAFGFLFSDEVEALRKYADKILDKVENPVVLVNLGSGAGTSGLVFAEAVRDADALGRSKRYTVDISPGGPLGGLQNEINAFAGTGLALPEQILGDTLDVGKNFPEDHIDLLFIDDDHSPAHVAKEIALWCPMVPVGGYVLFHDYDSAMWGELKPVIDEWVDQPGVKLVEVVHTLAVCQIVRTRSVKR